jgi:hypothetical protein
MEDDVLVAEVSLLGKNWLVGIPKIALLLLHVELELFPHSQLWNVSRYAKNLAIFECFSDLHVDVI